MKFHKAGSAAMALMLSSTLLLSACGSSNEPGGEQAAGEEGQPFQFSYMQVTRFINWLEDLKWYPELKKRMNTEVQLVDGGEGNQYYSNVDLRIGGGDFPDAVVTSLAQAEVYGSQGAFLDLKPLIEEHAPNLKKYMEENPDYEKLITASDGKIYGILDEYPNIAEVIFYRADMFEKAGITEQPRTIEELTEAFRKLKAHYGTDNRNYYPFTGREHFIKFTEVFKANDKIENGQVHGIYENGHGYDLYSEGFKQLVEWYHELYAEGLIDPEWVAGAATEEGWQTKMLTGNGSMSYDYYTRPAWFMINGGPQNDPDYDIQGLPYLLNMDGEQSVRAANARYSLDRVVVLNAKSADKAAGILRFIDYLYSEEGQTLVGWGVEGDSFQESGGKKEFISEFSVEEAKSLGEDRWSFLQDRMTFPSKVNNEAFYQWNTELVKDIASELFTDEYIQAHPILKYSTEQLRERTDLLASVKESALSQVVQFVNGSKPMSQWDSFLEQMEKEGYKRIVEIDQAAYDAMQ